MRRALLLSALLALAACGDIGPPKVDVKPLPPPQLVVVNKCPEGTPPIEALYLHSALGNYQGTKNHLTLPLKLEESTLIASLSTGQYYLTVIRPKTSFPGAALLAITTKTPLDLVTGFYELWVFEQSFRLKPPKAAVPDLRTPREASLHDLRPTDHLPLDVGLSELPRSDRAPRESGPDAPRDGGADAPHD